MVSGRRSISGSVCVQFGSTIHESLEPKLQRQQDKDLVRRIHPTLEVIPHKPRHFGGPK
jgi:hypothetical protein